MTNRTLQNSLAALVALVGCVIGTSAFAQESEAAYARYYGDGLRHYAEGNFSAAVENLFRAYAVEPEASTMGLIVASYDKMGFCDAALRQIDVHRLVHPDTKIPTLQRCKSTGTVTLACEGPEAAVIVDRQFEVACGQEVTLPVGEHRLSAERSDGPKRVDVEKGRAKEIALKFSPAPTRWKAAVNSPSVSKLSDGSAKVARLERAGLGYTVFLSNDGLYRVYIHPSAGDAGHVFSLPMRPDVLRLCDSGEQFDRNASECVPISGMQIQKME
ncbi:hypothetical protein FIV42_21475 [Persicimonas caeni]|uniref:Tetratricopeptide repeat protein n=1 Tax=Persicimonas caeni TaxID=2292766 RepID=A0A4Y6PY97_PERCE|nr:hypothetical protein [Persicimonas caeni]QDG53223.1 hypothetical protein FIV42_21475 [Persicimonas caeni]QED34445.1 hypothetical protein FRD00_21470 [Persicimonas caeni]